MDCDAVTAKPIENGWSDMQIAEDEDHPVNGWRCPTCIMAWDALFDRPDNCRFH
jgi:hypothetical protein